MKRIAIFCLAAAAILMLLSGAALAQTYDTLEEYPKVDRNRLAVDIPKGMAADVTIEDGYIGVVIDVEETDWQSVMIHGGYPHVRLGHWADRPDACYDTHIGFSGNGIYEEKMSAILNRMASELAREDVWENESHRSGNGEALGEIVADQSMLIPNRDKSGHLICWMDKEDRSNLYYEFYEVEFRFTQEDSFYVPFRSTPKSSLEATYSALMPSGARVKEVQNGDIIYQITDTQRDFDVPLVLAAPEGAVRLVYGDLSGGDSQPHAVVNGRVELQYRVYGNSGVREDQAFAVWYDAQDQVLDYGVFYIHAEPEVYKPWPNYLSAAGWRAPSADRIRMENECEDLGVTLKYTPSSGILHVGYDQEAMVSGDLGKIKVQLEAPSGAKAYRINTSGGNIVMGTPASAERDRYIQHNILMEEETHAVDNSGVISLMDREPMRHYNAGPVDVYIQMDSVWLYGGGVYAIYWYESVAAANANPAAPLYIEYVVNTTDALCTTSKTATVEKEEDIQAPVQDVTCVGRPAQDGWHLVIRRHPQRGHNACHYELHLENDRGDYTPLEGTMVFYMPYPKGHDHHGGHEYKLRHYENDYGGYQLVDVRATEFGIRFEVASLSPFVLDWGDYQDPDEENPGDGGNEGGSAGGGEHPSERPFTLRFLSLTGGHRATIKGGRFSDVEIMNDGFAQFTDSAVREIRIMPVGEVGAGNGLFLKGCALAETLVFFLGEEDEAWTEQTFIHVQDEANIGVLVLEGDYLRFNPNWLDYENAGEMWVVLPMAGMEMSYEQFLSALRAGDL